MKVIIEFDTDNAAFEEPNYNMETRSVLTTAEKVLASYGAEPQFRHGKVWSLLHDSSGDAIGKVEVRS